jgi:glycosyltransferase involved in cell wall biosynthesis
MISVCLCTYNGEKYIRQQLNSILEQISEHDEIIINDDMSSDETIHIIESYTDRRIKLVVNDENVGFVKNFEKAMLRANGDIILLSDQDDIWTKNRLNIIIDTMDKTKKNFLIGNYIEIESKGTFIEKSLKKHKILSKYNGYGAENLFRVLIGKRIPYFGCCMALKKQVVPYIAPFPKVTESHDVWIAIYANVKNDLLHIEDNILCRRIHDKNLSAKKRSLLLKLRSRLIWILLIFIAIYRKNG